MIDSGSRPSVTTLDDLRSELVAMTDIEPTGKYDLLADELPLLHRTSYPERLLKGAQLVPGDGSKHREELGVGGCTFFWVGRLSYDDARFVLVWEAEAERVPPDGYGAPWDTGGLLTKGTLNREMNLEQARHAIERYSLPLGEYREYLSLVIETCFESPADYLRDSGRPLRWYPGHLSPPSAEMSPPARTFEVRRAGPVEIKAGLLAAIPNEEWFVGQPRLLRNLRQRVKHMGATWEEPRAGELPQVTAARFVARYLRDRGHG